MVVDGAVDFETDYYIYKSSHNSVYVPTQFLPPVYCLQFGAVFTPGTFVQLTCGVIGLVIKTATCLEDIHPISARPKKTSQHGYLLLNIYKGYEGDMPDIAPLPAPLRGMPEVLRSEYFCWTRSESISSVVFVFSASLALQPEYYPVGMNNVYICRYLLKDSVVPNAPYGTLEKHTWEVTAFPNDYGACFYNTFLTSYSKDVYTFLSTVRTCLGNIFCTLSQKQSQRTVKKVAGSMLGFKYVEDISGTMMRDVTVTKWVPILQQGLYYDSKKVSLKMKALRFSDEKGWAQLRKVFGIMSTIGVRKKRKRAGAEDEESLSLEINDVVNILLHDPDDSDDEDNEDDRFRLRGVSEDGIDLLYEPSTANLTIIVRYSKLVVRTLSDKSELQAQFRIPTEDDPAFNPSLVLAKSDEFVHNNDLFRILELGPGYVVARKSTALGPHEDVILFRDLEYVRAQVNAYLAG